jgi:hypothetical protein
MKTTGKKQVLEAVIQAALIAVATGLVGFVGGKIKERLDKKKKSVKMKK